MSDWRSERERVTAGFDGVAAFYRESFADELDHKPFDRALLDRIATALRAGPTVLEVGAGCGHIGAYLADRGVAMVVSDASWGQLREARVLSATRPLLRTDLASLPLAPHSLGGIVAFYCLIYGPVEHLDAVFADWHRALRPGGVTVVAVHAGRGTIPVAEGITVVLRQPEDLVAALERHGFDIEECTVRPPYDDEHQTERCYLVAATPGRADG